MSERADLKTRLCRLRYHARAVASAHPSVYLPFARRKYGSDGVVSPETEVVIEGFQRSGNTFAVIGFELAQDRPVKIAHHLHAAAQVATAARMGIPTLVLIREPEEAAISHMLREPCITGKQALASWIRFYDGVLPHRDRIVVGEFGAVTADLGSVIRRINERFGTSFAEFEHTATNVDRCFELIDQRNRERYGTIVQSHVARPSAERETLKAAVRDAVCGDAVATLRARAWRRYRALTGAPGA